MRVLSRPRKAMPAPNFMEMSRVGKSKGFSLSCFLCTIAHFKRKVTEQVAGLPIPRRGDRRCIANASLDNEMKGGKEAPNTDGIKAGRATLCSLAGVQIRGNCTASVPRAGWRRPQVPPSPADVQSGGCLELAVARSSGWSTWCIGPIPGLFRDLRHGGVGAPASHLAQLLLISVVRGTKEGILPRAPIDKDQGLASLYSRGCGPYLGFSECTVTTFYSSWTLPAAVPLLFPWQVRVQCPVLCRGGQ